MTNPIWTPIYCIGCGRVMGKRPGVSVVQGAICSNPICNFQSPPTINMDRDALICAAVHDGARVAEVARQTQVSRQRVYQIVEAWKRGDAA